MDETNEFSVSQDPSLGSLGQKNFTNGREDDDEDLIERIRSDSLKTFNFDHGLESFSSCWPLNCASAKKISHKSLKIFQNPNNFKTCRN